ncbi:DNA mismatch repair protein Mlh3 isoform X2 [Corythoichthys intestinalis]|uniref:DNA mismatch repair protein Mlh3 isoform X2 n=1 Tax=Corythoichthys intestinalis TaxID=161448 RepID=UPI0025A68670|nr:DNA mismatch repair protein Mlh3 isoform X2 [Corythoichthys intestinalis]XP_061798023.1 DNA mismatch repair protein Mlh3-like [Nerophis lumbriciformis]
MIKCLSEEVRVRLRSGVAVPSLQQCVEELVLNSLDAGATCVGIRMDLDALKVQVIDNGAGMSAEDMARVGNRYHSGKCHSLDDLDELKYYGFRGEAIASIVALATLVEISSRARNAEKTLVRLFKNGKGMEVFENDDCRPTAGTTVVVCNFFHNMPVRRKRMDLVLEGERIRHRVEAVSLMHPSVSFTLKNDRTGAVMVQLPKSRDTYHRFVQIHGLTRARKLGEIRHTRAPFEVTGHLGREGHYNGGLQFLYVNGRLLLRTRIHALLNSLLRGLRSPTRRNDSPEKRAAVGNDAHRRGQDLHGVYVVNIKCSYSEYDINLEPSKTLIEFKDWDGVLLCVEEAVNAFLRREKSPLSQDDTPDASPRSFPVDDAAREDAGPDRAVPTPSVHRKHEPSDVLRPDNEGPVDQINALRLAENAESKFDQTENEIATATLRPPDSAGEEKTSRTICVRFPFVHECLQDNAGKAAGQHLSKRKISLTSQNSERSDIPSKISKVLSVESGSLDEFRRMYGKSVETNVTSSEKQTNPRRLPPNFLEDTQNVGLSLNRKTKSDERRHEAHHLEYAELKRTSPSLTGKLNRLKQKWTKDQRRDRSAPVGNECFQDGYNDATNTHEGTAASTDWLRHFDSQTGKTAYVNKVTGLSKYEEPPKEGKGVRCTSDITNMAISVVSETGTECRCYPFQADLVLPFLPEDKEQRVLSAGTDDNVRTFRSLSSLYSKWKNPVFVRPPEVAVDVSSGQADGLAVKIHNILYPYRFSKAMIHSMKVMNQVDNKFLACLINTTDDTDTEGNLLVLLDQHAAHERVRLEKLIADSLEDDPNARGQKRLCSSTISPPLRICVTEEEQRLIRARRTDLRRSGLEVTFSERRDNRVLVGKVPLCFVEKENTEHRRKRPSVIKRLVEDYLREEMELLRSTGTVKGTLPLTVLKVLASLACHGAVKFNHPLNRDECRSLAASLSSCRLPFQCAHGRPSIAPLLDVLHLEPERKEPTKPNLRKLRSVYKAWLLYGNE